MATVIDLTTAWCWAGNWPRTCAPASSPTPCRRLSTAGHVMEPQAIFHSDRRTQYTSAEFAAFTAKNEIRRSGAAWQVHLIPAEVQVTGQRVALNNFVLGVPTSWDVARRGQRTVLLPWVSEPFEDRSSDFVDFLLLGEDEIPTAFAGGPYVIGQPVASLPPSSYGTTMCPTSTWWKTTGDFELTVGRTQNTIAGEPAVYTEFVVDCLQGPARQRVW